MDLLIVQEYSLLVFALYLSIFWSNWNLPEIHDSLLLCSYRIGSISSEVSQK